MNVLIDSIVPIQDLREKIENELTDDFLIPIGFQGTDKESYKIKVSSLQKVLQTSIVLDKANNEQDGIITKEDYKLLHNLPSNLVNGEANGSLRTITSLEQFSSYSLGQSAFSEGLNTKAEGNNSHAEGENTIASKRNAHAEGYNTIASGENSHAQNKGTIASQVNQTAIGRYNKEEDSSVAFMLGIGDNDATRRNSIIAKWDGSIETIGGIKITPNGKIFLGETIENNQVPNKEYVNQAITNLNNTINEISGSTNNLNDFITNTLPTTIQTAINNKHYITNLVDGNAIGSVRGTKTTIEDANYTLGQYAFAEGHNTKASGNSSHAEGILTEASGNSSHAEGNNTKALTENAHAEGYYTIASGEASHAANYKTIAQRADQTVIGAYNIPDITGNDGEDHGDYIFIIGNGTAENARSNAFTVDWSGNTYLAGNLNCNNIYSNNLFPIGSLYITSTNTNPSSSLGGTWQLIDKKLADLSATTGFIYANNTKVSGQENTFYIRRYGNVLQLFFKWYNKYRLKNINNNNKSVDDETWTIGKIPLSDLGLNNIHTIRTFSSCDGLNGIGLCTVKKDTIDNIDYCVLTMYDFVSRSTTFSDDKEEEFYLQVTFVIPKNHMLDSACDKFYWKRVS